MQPPWPSTFSIVGFDPKTKDLGVAVESKFVAVGAVVPFARAGVGAVATQSYANTTYGPKALTMLKQDVAPKDVLQRLVKSDKEAAQRQAGVVDAKGRSASYTGKECFPWAGHLVGRNYACQGNLLAGADVVKGMGRAFEATQGDLPVRLLAALSAGQRAGGDKRGQQSAALLVVRDRGGYGGFNDRWIAQTGRCGEASSARSVPRCRRRILDDEKRTCHTARGSITISTQGRRDVRPSMSLAPGIGRLPLDCGMDLHRG